MRNFIDIVGRTLLAENVIPLGRRTLDNNTVPKDFHDVLERNGFSFTMEVGDIPDESVVGYEYRNGDWTIEVGVKQQKKVSVLYVLRNDEEVTHFNNITAADLDRYLSGQRFKHKATITRLTQNEVFAMLIDAGFRNTTKQRTKVAPIQIGDKGVYEDDTTTNFTFTRNGWLVELLVRTSDHVVLRASIYNDDLVNKGMIHEVTRANMAALLRRTKGLQSMFESHVEDETAYHGSNSPDFDGVLKRRGPGFTRDHHQGLNWIGSWLTGNPEMAKVYAMMPGGGIGPIKTYRVPEGAYWPADKEHQFAFVMAFSDAFPKFLNQEELRYVNAYKVRDYPSVKELAAENPNDAEAQVRLRNYRIAENIVVAKLIQSHEFMTLVRDRLLAKGYQGIVWRDSKIDLNYVDHVSSHDVYLIFHDEPLHPED